MEIEFIIKMKEVIENPSMQQWDIVVDFAHELAKGFKEKLGAVVNMELDFKGEKKG